MAPHTSVCSKVAAQSSINFHSHVPSHFFFTVSHHLFKPHWFVEDLKFLELIPATKCANLIRSSSTEAIGF